MKSYLELCFARVAARMPNARLGILKLESISRNLPWLDYLQSCNGSAKEKKYKSTPRTHV